MAKLKTAGNVSGSLQHMLRENGKAPNADPDRTMFNDNSVYMTREGMKKFYAMEPEFKQSNNVQAIEFLVTASPEFFQNSAKSEWMNYLNDGLKWIKGLIGEKNIVASSIQLDETTPHLSVIARPIVERKFKGGKVKTALAAARYMDGSALLSKTQDNFHDEVANKYDLERGNKGTKASHQTVQDWYGEQAGGAARVRELEAENQRLQKIIEEERESANKLLKSLESEIEKLKEEGGRWRKKASDVSFTWFSKYLAETTTHQSLDELKSKAEQSSSMNRSARAKLAKAINERLIELTPKQNTKPKGHGR